MGLIMPTPGNVILNSVAGTALQQRQGTDKSDKTQESLENQKRMQKAVEETIGADGAKKTEEDEATEERDADGRRLWEFYEDEEEQQEEHGKVADPTGTLGSQLDLEG